MRGYSVSPRVSPVCGGAVLSIEGVDTALIDEQNITVLGKNFNFENICENRPNSNGTYTGHM